MILVDPYESDFDYPESDTFPEGDTFLDREKRRKRITCPAVICEMNEWFNQFLCPQCKGELKQGPFSMVCHPCVLSYRSLPNDDIAKEWQ